MAKEPVRIVLSNGIVFEPDKIDVSLSDEAKQILCKLDNKVFVIEDYMEPDANLWHPVYDNLIQTLIMSMHHGYEHEEFRNHKVQFKFTHDDEVELVSFKNFITNLIFWYPFVCFKYLLPENIEFKLTKKHFISDRRALQMSKGFIKSYWDDMYIRPYGKYIEVPRLHRIFGNAMYTMQQFCINFERFLGISISVEAFRYLAAKYPRYDELLHMKLDGSKQPAEIEADVKKASDEQLAIIEQDEGFHIIKCLIRDTKLQQLNEVQLVIALKADQDGKTIPYPLNTNFIVDGLNTIPQLYINNIAGRKAAIINDEFMGSSGHSLIQVTIATNSVRLSKTTKDCLTVNPIPITIRTKKHLEKINGRRYRIGNERSYHTVDCTQDESLIGQTVWLRSPVTCACQDGICQECYGELFRINESLNSAGAYASVTIMNPCVQELLSAKHFQGTNSHIIDFNDSDFERFFNITSTEIIMNSTSDDNLDEYSIVIRQEDMQSTDPDLDDLDEMFTRKSSKRKKRKSEEDDEEEDDGSDMMNMQYFTTKFYVVRNLKSKTIKDREIYQFSDIENKELYMHDDFVNRLSVGKDTEGAYLYIDFENIDPQEFIFAVDVANNELTKPIKSIDKLINTKDHEGCDSIDTLVQKMLDLLIDARLKAVSVHAEMILYKLIRAANNVLKRPDFANIVTRKDYQILTIKTSLKKDPSIDTAISTPFLRMQLVQDPVTYEKTAPSDYDLSFRPYVDEDEMGRPLIEVYPDGNIEL